MSEDTGVRIEIGGKLRKSKIRALLKAVENDMSEIEGPITRKDLIANTGTLYYNGLSNNGNLDELTAFCKKNNLSFKHRFGSGPEWEPGEIYWEPGKDETDRITNVQGDALVSEDDVRPVMNLLLALYEQGPKCLPLFLNEPALTKIVERGLKKSKDIVPAIKEHINDFMPEFPELPDFELIE